LSERKSAKFAKIRPTDYNSLLRTMKHAEYLSRIGVDASGLNADLESLRLLQRRHLLTVPFENLDIHWKRPIVLDTAKFFEKIVGEKRGGFCYELNGLLNELLHEIGFRTRLVSARVYGNGVFGPEFDHAAIFVTIGELEYLSDVGFGDFTAEPLRFVADIEQQDKTGVFTIRQSDDGYFEVAKKNGDSWTPQYMFKPLGRDLSEFAEMCDFQQYSPESHFTQGKVCSLMTENGRKTLTDKKFIVTATGGKTEKQIDSENEFAEILQREFGIAQSKHFFRNKL
jgi:N-hydroxyarylamine O-acetyltransferase